MTKRRQTFWRLLKQIRPYRRKLVISIASAAGVAATQPLIPLFVRDAIDEAIPRGDYGSLWRLIALMIGVAILKAIFHGLRRQIAGEISVGVEGDLRERLYNHVQALDVGYHERISTGQIMSRATSDINAIRQYLMGLPWSITNVLQILAILGIMFALSPGLGLVFAATAPLLGWYTYRFSARFDPIVYRMQQKLADLASVVEETVVGIRVVKAFGRERDQVRKLEQDADGVYTEAMETIRLRAGFVPFFQAVPQLGLVAVLWFGGRAAVNGSLTPGTLLAMFSLLYMLVWPLRALGMIVGWMQRAITAAGRVFEVLDTPPGIADKPGAAPLRTDGGTIRFEDVRFAYPEGGPVLAGIDLEIRAGSSLALVGQTGCGKSTLMRLLPRFIEPVSGRVTIDGQNVSDVTLASLRSKIGIVFEDTLLFSDTISANIAFGRPDASEEEVVRAALVAQAHSFIEDLPEGYETVVGEHGYTLSGGQRQRIALARAILMNPRVLILDDATSSVDAQVEAAIRKGLTKAMAGRTTLIVARRPQTAALADRVAFMAGGRIIDIGTHDELWHAREAYRETLLVGGQIDAVSHEVEEHVS